MKRGLDGDLPDGIDVVYVSPLKALSSDIQRNLEAPLDGIREVAREMGIAPPEIRTALRTGDTTQAARAAILRARAAHPDHDAGVALPDAHGRAQPRAAAQRAHGHRRRAARADARQARQPPDAHARAPRRAVRAARRVRIGLSATVHPIEDAARYLVGTARSRRRRTRPTARSSTSGTGATSTSRSKCRRPTCRPSRPASSGPTSTTASPS